MGRFWIGVALLMALLTLGFFAGTAMEQNHNRISDMLEQAAQSAAQGQLERGAALGRQAADHWQQHRNATAAMADHAPMEEIDSLFAQLKIYETTGQADCFATCSAKLSMLVRAVGEAHSLSWWNLL